MYHDRVPFIHRKQEVSEYWDSKSSGEGIERKGNERI